MENMTSFDDLIAAYRTSSAELFKQVEALSAQKRHDLLLENIERKLHANRVEEEEQVASLPREYRRLAGVRWDHFGYVLHYFDRSMLERQLQGHLEIEVEDSKAAYMQHMLEMLVWMSIDHVLDEGQEFEADAVSRRGRRRG